MKRNRKSTQTLESAQYGLKIMTSVLDLTLEVVFSILLPFFFHEYVHNTHCLVPLPNQVEGRPIPVLKEN